MKALRLLLAMLLLLLLTSPAFATEKHPKPTPAKPASTSAKANASAYSASSAGSASTAGIVDASRVVYEAERLPTNTAAQAVESYCGGGALSAQTPGFGVSMTGGRDRVCARLALSEARLAPGDRLAETANGIRSIMMALEVDDDIKGGSGHIAKETMAALAAQVYREAVEQYRKSAKALDQAEAELELDNTAVRRANVTFFGSLPILNHLAPR